MVTIEIDKRSGFCYGVVHAINKAEQEMIHNAPLYCLGDIVHNKLEVERLERKGLRTINYDQFKELKNQRILFRAHGEPPAIYKAAEVQGLSIIDATCPVVLKLQQRIREAYQGGVSRNTQIVIFGKRGHAEVNGLMGQVEGNAIVIQSLNEIDQLDFNRPIWLISQTTMSIELFEQLTQEIKKRIKPGVAFTYTDTICRQVGMRIPHIGEFARKHNRIFFVAGAQSSNGKVLYQECLMANANSFFIERTEEITAEMLPQNHNESIGICGATSTPRWQMEEVATHLQKLIPESEII